MPASQTPINPNTPTPEETSAAQSPEQNQPSDGNSDAPIMLGRSSSRYVDYDSHELLERISQYEDERRWQRIREGIWISIIAHILLFAALYLVPRYVFNQTQVIDPFDAIKQRKDLTYLDELPDALKQLQKAKPKLPPLKQSETIVDKKTLDALKAAQAARAKVTPPAPKPAETPAPAPPQVAQTPQPPQPAPLPPSTAAPTPNPQVALDAPRPSPVPAKPNFNLGSQNPADQLRQAMKNSATPIFRLPALAGKLGFNLARLPFSLKILLENLLRREDGVNVTAGDICFLANWKADAEPSREIAYMPARVLMQDFTGVPAIVDLAAMRDAMKTLGGDPEKINPLQPAELVIDHSVQVDEFGSPQAPMTPTRSSNSSATASATPS
jgi:hypothetical protein